MARSWRCGPTRMWCQCDTECLTVQTAPWDLARRSGPRRAPGCRALVAGSGSLVAGSGSLPPWSVRKKILVYGVDGSRTRMRILVYEYLKASPRKRGLCDEVVRDGKAA